MTSPDAFFIFSKFWFSGLLGWGEGGQEGKGQKMIQNVKKNLSHSVSPELYLIWLLLLVHMGKMISQKKLFFHFFKILIFWVFQSSSINAKRKFWGVSHLLHMCVVFMIYANDVPQAVKSNLLLYAYDSCIIDQHKNIAEFQKRLKRDFENIYVTSLLIIN